MHNFSKGYRRQLVSMTAEQLATELFEAEGHNKRLCEINWDEYRTHLVGEEQKTAIEAFDARTKELNNGQ